MSLSEIFHNFNFEKVSHYIEELAGFYFKPKSFFSKFFRRSFKEKFSQTLFYSILLITAGYILTDENTLKDLTKALILELSRLIGICAILLSSLHIIKSFTKENYKPENVVFFAILVKILISPFQLIFYGLFINIENYNYLFLANLVILISFVYYFLLSANFFHAKTKFVALGIFLNLLLLNAFVGLDSTLDIDEYSAKDAYYDNKILEERIDIFNMLPDFEKLPSTRVIYKRDEINGVSSHFLFSKPFDTIAEGSFKKSKNYHKNIDKSIDILENTIDTLRFKRNEQYFSLLNNHLKSVDSVFDKKVIKYSKREIKDIDVVVSSTDSTVLFKRLFIDPPKKMTKQRMKLIEKKVKIVKSSYYAMLPYHITNYFLPIILLLENKPQGYENF